MRERFGPVYWLVGGDCHRFRVDLFEMLDSLGRR
jgi:hypothetical protein